MSFFFDYFKNENKQNLTKKFWQNLIWIWVSYYISSNFYRWKKIENITTRKKYNFVDLNYTKNFYYSVVNAYKNLISNSDLYNYLSIRKIINCFENRIKKVAVLKGDLNDKLINYSAYHN